MSDELKRYLEHAAREMIPMMKDSALSIAILNADPDPKLCLEIGAAIMLDKPLIILVPRGERVPANLKRVASRIVFGEPNDPKVQAEIQDAITSVMENDARLRT